jgi:hypothetical protein
LHYSGTANSRSGLLQTGVKRIKNGRFIILGASAIIAGHGTRAGEAPDAALC